MNEAIGPSVLAHVPAVKLPLLQGVQVRVRPATAADAADWFVIRTESGPGQPAIPSVAEARRRLAEIDSRPSGQPGWRQWMVEDKAGRILGDVALRWPSIDAPAELGFELKRSARGRGLALEAVGLLCDWALGPGGFPLLASVTQKTNQPAQRLFQRLDFLPLRGGELFDMLEVTDDELLYFRRRPVA